MIHSNSNGRLTIHDKKDKTEEQINKKLFRYTEKIIKEMEESKMRDDAYDINGIVLTNPDIIPGSKKKRLYNTLTYNNKYMKTQENLTVKNKIDSPLIPKRLNDKFSFDKRSEKSLKTVDLSSDQEGSSKNVILKKRQEYKELKNTLKLSDTDILKKIRAHASSV